MRRAIAAATLIFTLSMIALAQLSPSPPDNLSKQEKREYPVRLAEQTFRYSLMRNDRETLNKLLADECTITNHRGETRNKIEYLEYLRIGEPTLDNYKAENVRVNFSKKNVATVTGRAIVHERRPGEDVTTTGHFTRVYEKRRGTWLLISSRTILEPPNQ